MTEQIITTTNGYKFDRDAVLTAKEVIFGTKTPANGTVGYFADNFNELCISVNTGDKGELHHCEAEPYPFFMSECLNYAFFLPEDAVIAPKEEKKFKPFDTEDELFGTLQKKLGEPIIYRRKDRQVKGLYISALITSIIKEDECPVIGKLVDICFGSDSYSPQELFDEYEWQDVQGDWLPFGVEITKEQEND